ncbi:MAG: hypothetical protein ACLQDC_11725, partial [Verrucomicrobiia bacterium]
MSVGTGVYRGWVGLATFSPDHVALSDVDTTRRLLATTRVARLFGAGAGEDDGEGAGAGFEVE